MTQEILTKEEVEKRNRLDYLNNQIVAGSKKAIAGEVMMLKGFYEIKKYELWKLRFNEIKEWLEYLRDRGVIYSARSTFYEKIELMGKYSCVVDEDLVARLAAEHPGPLKMLESEKAFTFTKTGRGLQASYNLVGVNRDIVGDDPKEYLQTFTNMRKRRALAKAKRDTGKDESTFVDRTRVYELYALQSPSFDLSKLIRLCEELNLCYANQCYFAVAMLLRSVLDHVPPIFGCKNFAEVIARHGTRSFKESMQHLDSSSRKIADAHLHGQIRGKETLPNKTQVNFSSDLDVLVAEIVRVLK